MGVSHSAPHPVETKWFNEYAVNLPNLEGKTVVITGTTSGTGNIVAKLAVDKQAKNVLLLNRPSDRATSTTQDLKDAAQSNTNIEGIDCDLQDFASVQAAADAIKAKYDSVDVLCNNAGVMALEDKPTKKDGYDIQMQTNHLSHFLLTKELYPLLTRAKELRGQARVVNHSSGARHSPPSTLEAKYLEKVTEGSLGGDSAGMFFNGPRWQRYHQTKLANSVFTKALADRFGESGLIAAVAAPGLAATNLQVSTAKDGGMDWKTMWIMRMSQSAEDGAMPLAAACFDPSASNGDFWEPNGRGNMTGPATKVEWDKLSLDEASRKLLWEKSEEACGKFEV